MAGRAAAPPPKACGGAGRLTCGLATAILGAILAVAPADAQQSDRVEKKLRSIERELDEGAKTRAELTRQAEQVRGEILALREATISAARRTQDLESELSALEVTVAVMQSEALRKFNRMEVTRLRLDQVLGALQRIALQPPDALLLAPRPPLDSVRGAMLLNYAAPQLQQEATRLRSELQELESLREDIVAQRQSLDDTARDLAREQKALLGLIGRKTQLESSLRRRAQGAQQRVATLADQADDLRDLIERIGEEEKARRRVIEQQRLVEATLRLEAARKAEEDEARRQAAEAEEQLQESVAFADVSEEPALRADLRPANLRSFPDQQGTLTWPARGRIVAQFDEPSNEAGAGGVQGLTVETRAGAQIVAPFDGKVVYAGPFRGYGLILIIEHDGAYHSLLSGMDRIDAVLGQWLLAGEPIGAMAIDEAVNHRLYFELRRDGQPINPLPWVAQLDARKQG